MYATTFGNKSMNFKFVCETVSRQEVCTGRAWEYMLAQKMCAYRAACNAKVKFPKWSNTYCSQFDTRVEKLGINADRYFKPCIGASSLQTTMYGLHCCDMTLQIVEPSWNLRSNSIITVPHMGISLEWATSSNVSIEYALIVAGIGS